MNAGSRDAAGEQPGHAGRFLRMDLTDIPVTTIDGEQTTLAPYKGKVMLVVNVASRCGLSP